MKRILTFMLNKLSRVVYHLIPKEVKEENNNLNFLNRNLIAEMNQEVLETFSNDLKKSIRFNDEISIRKYAINLALSNEHSLGNLENLYYLEFGVWKGKSSNFFSRYINKLYSFDSFEGLPNEWEGQKPKGYFNLNKKIPKLNSNIEPIIGYVEDTLDGFLKEHNPKINFIHMDMDLYQSSKFTLSKVKPYLQKGSIILFDELYNYINWKSGEYKALKEIFEDHEYIYRSFNLQGAQVAIQIL